MGQLLGCPGAVQNWPYSSVPETLESWTHLSEVAALRTVGSACCPGSSGRDVDELSLRAYLWESGYHYLSALGRKGNRDDCPPTSCSLKSCPRGHEHRELALPFISCSTQKIKPCILPGQHSRVDPGGGCSDEPFPNGKSEGALAQQPPAAVWRAGLAIVLP